MLSVTQTHPAQPDLREKAFKALNQLPAFNPTLNKLLATLAKEDVFFSEVAAVIEKDTVLAGNVLKLVNSALYSRSGTINSVRNAVAILGLSKLRNLALSLSVSRMFKQMKTAKSWSQADFNLHSVATAIMADTLAQRLPVSYPEGAFTAGLLHAVGKLLIAVALPDEFDRIVRTFHDRDQGTIEDVEMEIIGCCHSELAAAALAQWKLPSDIQEAVAHQHLKPAEPLHKPGCRMHLSALLYETHKIVNQLDAMIPACACRGEAGVPERLQRLGLEGETDKILEEYKAEFDAMRSFF
ncbi:MAG: HDOD domain-containing protein [Bryobacterales bacterium]|nr:HDOD domain-containing protein [Bryobacterales bacterium]